MAPDGSLVVVDTYNHRLQRFVRDESADDDPPATSCAGPSWWATAPAEVTLTATDGGSGVAATYARVDGGKFRGVVGATVRPGFSVADALSADCRVWVRLVRDGEQVWLKSLGSVEVSLSGRDVRPTIVAPRTPGRCVLTVTARDRDGNVGRRSIDLLVSER